MRYFVRSNNSSNNFITAFSLFIVQCFNVMWCMFSEYIITSLLPVKTIEKRVYTCVSQ